jgi:hypothetical protein
MEHHTCSTTHATLQVTNLEAQSSQWAKDTLQYLREWEEYSRRIAKALGPRTLGGMTVARAASVLASGGELAALLSATLRLPEEHRA